MNDAAVPAALRRLWRLPVTPSRRGRRSTLDVEMVVGTAVRLADEGGLDAATLPKVAEELGVTAMSLYRHVGSKHELLQLMMDAASEPVAPAPEGPVGWRAGLRRWATDLWSLYRDRPWIPRVPLHSAPSGPHQIAWLERGSSSWRPRISTGTRSSGAHPAGAVSCAPVLAAPARAGGGARGGPGPVRERAQYGQALHHLVGRNASAHGGDAPPRQVLAAERSGRDDTIGTPRGAGDPPGRLAARITAGCGAPGTEGPSSTNRRPDRHVPRPCSASPPPTSPDPRRAAGASPLAG